MNILIIEDEVFLANRIQKIFEGKVVSNRVRVVHSYLEFLDEFFIIASYDIILTDLKLSKDSKELVGYKIIQMIRQKQALTPIVVISGFSDVERLREAFSYGASDYIIKPIRLKELEIRVENWFKNYCLLNTAYSGSYYYYKDLRYDLNTNEFYLRETHIPLTKGNKYILWLFFTSPEKLLRDDYLVEKIWGDIYLTIERNLRVNIFRLKNSLFPFGIDTWIHNVRGEGYIFSEETSPMVH